MKIHQEPVLRAKVGQLTVLRISANKPAVKEYERENPADSEGWANRAYYCVEHAGVTVLAADYDYNGGDIGVLVHEDDIAEARSALSENAEIEYSEDTLDPEEGKSHFGDGSQGTIEVWRDGEDLVLLSGSQNLG